MHAAFYDSSLFALCNRETKRIFCFGKLVAAPEPVAVTADVFLNAAVFLKHDGACYDVVEELTIVTYDDQRAFKFA